MPTATATPALTPWMPMADLDAIPWISWDGAALDARNTGDGWAIVRPTADGRYAAIITGEKFHRGARRLGGRVAMLADTPGPARAYIAAVAR